MWVCYRYKPENLQKRMIKVGQIDLPPDCFGDSLYAYMIGKGLIKDLEDFTVKGNDKVVVVTGKYKSQGQFFWRYYEEYAEEIEDVRVQ